MKLAAMAIALAVSSPSKRRIEAAAAAAPRVPNSDAALKPLATISSASGSPTDAVTS